MDPPRRRPISRTANNQVLYNVGAGRIRHILEQAVSTRKDAEGLVPKLLMRFYRSKHAPYLTFSCYSTVHGRATAWWVAVKGKHGYIYKQAMAGSCSFTSSTTFLIFNPTVS